MGFMVRRSVSGETGCRCALDFTRAVLFCLFLASSMAHSADVGLAGLFPGKALLTINGGPPRIVALGVTTEEGVKAVSYTHLRAHETDSYLVCRLLLEKK